MTLLQPQTDYSDKDFDSLRERLINLIRSAFPDWTDFNIANFGNILMELKAFVGDVLLFYQDNQAGESRISTAQLRRSLIALAKLVGFVPDGATAAQVEATITLAEPPIDDVQFLAGDTIRTLKITDPTVFQLLTGGTVAAGADPPTIVVTAENSANS